MANCTKSTLEKVEEFSERGLKFSLVLSPISLAIKQPAISSIANDIFMTNPMASPIKTSRAA